MFIPVAIFGTKLLAWDAFAFPFLRDRTYAVVVEACGLRPNACQSTIFNVMLWSGFWFQGWGENVELISCVALPESKMPTMTAFPNFALFHNDSLGTFPDSSSSPRNSHERVVCSFRSRLGKTEITRGDAVIQKPPTNPLVPQKIIKKQVTNDEMLSHSTHKSSHTCKASCFGSSDRRSKPVEHMLVAIQHS